MIRILTSSRFYHGTPWILPSNLDSPVFLTLDLGTAKKYANGSVAYASRRPASGAHKYPSVYSVSFTAAPRILNTMVPAQRQYYKDIVRSFNRMIVDEDEFVSPLGDSEVYPSYGQVATMWKLVRGAGYAGMFVAETGRDSSLMMFSRHNLKFSRARELA